MTVRIEWYADRLIEQINQAALDGIEEWAHLVLTDAKENCPVDHGTLRSTGVIEILEKLGVRIAFGGPAAPYAEIQHERSDYFHTVGEDHWLENAFNAHLYGGGVELLECINRHLAKVLS